jgi:hypothetical protein
VISAAEMPEVTRAPSSMAGCSVAADLVREVPEGQQTADHTDGVDAEDDGDESGPTPYRDS